ncbi:MAG: helix-turn-helix domain-containing protein [Planctomycetota bacterium]
MPRANQQLKELRLQRGLTQAELAARSRIAKRTIQFAEKGQNVSLDTLNRLADAMNVGVAEITLSRGYDALLEEPWSLYRFVVKGLMPERAAFCDDLRDMRNGIEQMRKSWETHLRENADIRDSRYASAFRAQKGQYRDIYERKYARLWEANSNTIVFATSNGLRNGVSVVFPVTDDAYSALKNGNLGFLEIDKQHICQHSQNLVIDSGVEYDVNQPFDQISSALRYASFFQVAFLSEDLSNTNFRMLSFGASSANSSRLEANGFVVHSTKTPDLGYPIYEFTSDNSDLSGDRQLRKSTIAHYASEFKMRITNSKLGLKAKRKIMLWTARIFQNLINRRLISNSGIESAA